MINIKSLRVLAHYILEQKSLSCLCYSKPAMVYKNLFYFGNNLKSNQLILHQPQTIQKMHQTKASKKNKEKQQWQTINDLQNQTFVVSIVGLPNCGKSTLFNCLIGQKLAIVDKLAGMTRDRKEYGILNGLIKFIDTPGVELNLNNKKQNQKLKEDIFMQTIHALHKSHLILFVIDAKQPLTSNQMEFSKYLKTFGQSKNIILVCNKFDGGVEEEEIINNVSNLGFERMFMCSGQYGIGVLDLLNHIHSSIPNQIKQSHQTKLKERKQKFEKIIQKMKEELKQLKLAKGLKIDIREWERDFRKINSEPQNNSNLDSEIDEKYFVRPQDVFSNSRGAQIKNVRMKNSIEICFIGRPNVGKSSLINELLGQERLIVSQIPHTTRDSIITKILYKDRKIELIDTAGLNTPNLDENDQEYLRKVQISTMLHVKKSHVVVYVMDAFSSFQIHDFKLIKSVIQEGRPLIIAVNKWQSIRQQFRYKAKNYLNKQIQQNLGQLNGYPIVFISAKMRTGLTEMMDKIISVYDRWNTRISTGLLNDWLQRFKKLDNLPIEGKKSLKINYLIQARVRPPLFVFFVNSKELFKDNYMRFLTENFAKQFQMDGIPIRTLLRSTNNNQNKRKKSSIPRKQSKTNKRMEQLKKKYGDFRL